MKLIVSLFFLLIIVIVAVFYSNNIREYFVSQLSKSYDSNKFKRVILDKMDNYDIEVGIPSGQYLYNTTQGNWGFSTDETNDGVVFGVYRDGYTADGSIFKGATGTRYKYMLEQGPYVIRYKVRKNENTDNYDVSIFVDDKLIEVAEGEGVSSDEITVIGTNYHNYNDEAKKDERGRRPVDYLKFIPKGTNDTKEGFTNQQSDNENTDVSVNFSADVKKANNLSNSDINEVDFTVDMCKKEGIFCNKIQDFNVDLRTGKIYYGDENEDDGKQSLTEQENARNLRHLFNAVDQDKDGMILESEVKILMDDLQINQELYNNVLKNMTPAGMDYKTFSSLIGQPIKQILRVVYEDTGKKGLKMMYKLMGYEYTEDEKPSESEEARKARLKKMYPETDYDKSNPSKSRYRSNYKPEHPRPEEGVHFYDSIWDFSNKY